VDWEKLIADAHARMTPEDWKRQRISFAYGNGALSNSRITRESVERAAEEMEVCDVKD
jgi:hypothetical protein